MQAKRRPNLTTGQQKKKKMNKLNTHNCTMQEKKTEDNSQLIEKYTQATCTRIRFEKIRFGVSTRIVRQSGDPVHTDVD